MLDSATAQQTSSRIKRTLSLLTALLAFVAATSISLSGCSPTQQLSVTVNAPGWDEETSTPIAIALYRGDVKEVLRSPGEGEAAPELIAQKNLKSGEAMIFEEVTEAGTYTLALVSSPTLADGTTFAAAESQVIEFNPQEGQNVVFDLTAIIPAPTPEENTTEQDWTYYSDTTPASTNDNVPEVAPEVPAASETPAAPAPTPAETEHTHSWSPIIVEEDKVGPDGQLTGETISVITGYQCNICGATQ